MGLPKITYGAKSIDFTRYPQIFDVFPVRSKLRNQSASGKSETLNVASGYSVSIRIGHFSNVGDADLKIALLEVAQWAESGQAWTFQRDSAISVNTTLDTAEAAGSTSLGVVSATGIVSGSRYALESETEVATVKATNSATDPVTISSALNAAFPVGSRFRDYEYLPMLGTLKIIEERPLWFHVEIEGRVDTRDL